MINVFVLDVLATFHPEEKEEFRIFLRSHYFNRGPNRETLIRLLDLFFDAQEQGEIENLEQHTIHEVLFPGKKVVENKVIKLISELKRHLQVFLTSRRYYAPQNEPNMLLDFSIELRQRGLNSRYQQTIEKIKKDLDPQTQETVAGYFFRHLVALEEHEWHSLFNKAKGDLNISNAVQHLDNYYRALKTSMLNTLILQQKMAVLSSDAIELLQEEWTLPKQYIEKNALVTVIWEIHQLLKSLNPEATRVHHFLEMLQNNEDKFTPANLVEFYAFLRNICSFQVEAGKLDFFRVLHEIQLDNLKRGYFYVDGMIPPNAYLNITYTALNVQAVDWAKSFVTSHKDRIIDENDTHDFFRMNSALCLFAEKKYAEALDSIPFGSSYSFYHMMARRLELKIYYEMDSDLLPYKIDAFKMFISRAGKTLPETLKERYVNFINFLRQLSLSPIVPGAARSEKMVKRILEKKELAEGSWLLEKAREMGVRKK